VLVSARDMKGNVVHIAAAHVIEITDSEKEWDDPDTDLVEILMTSRHKLTVAVADKNRLIQQIGQQSQRR